MIGLSEFQRALSLLGRENERASHVSVNPRETLRAALDPQSVAIVGASENPDKVGESREHRIDRPGRRSPVCGQRDGVSRTRGTLPGIAGKGQCR